MSVDSSSSLADILHLRIQMLTVAFQVARSRVQDAPSDHDHDHWHDSSNLNESHPGRATVTAAAAGVTRPGVCQWAGPECGCHN
eukprot:2550230-Rhodomonas_salina.1